ncbi:hypothetical protein P691DRAFT_629149, partial [Macrolepiota fuliginosa MF-IS2]
ENCQIPQGASDALYLSDLLGTEAGITTRAEFLEKSGASTNSGKEPPKRNTPTIED